MLSPNGLAVPLTSTRSTSKFQRLTIPVPHSSRYFYTLTTESAHANEPLRWLSKSILNQLSCQRDVRRTKCCLQSDAHAWGTAWSRWPSQSACVVTDFETDPPPRTVADALIPRTLVLDADGDVNLYASSLSPSSFASISCNSASAIPLFQFLYNLWFSLTFPHSSQFAPACILQRKKNRR